MEFIKKKYARRIARFDSLREYKGKVFFVRCFVNDDNNRENAILLKAALERFFPQLNFTLVIVRRSESKSPEIGIIDGIKEYKVKDLTNWHEYGSIFLELLSVQ